MRTSAWAVFCMVFASGCMMAQGQGQGQGQDEGQGTAGAQSVPPGFLAEVKADAAQRTGKAEKDIVVVSAESVTWSDTSLGCPMPGRMYAQMLVSGYRIVLRVGDQQLSYHAGQTGKFSLCPADRARPPAGSTNM